MQFFKSEKEIIRPKDSFYRKIQQQFVTIYHNEIDNRYDIEKIGLHEEIQEANISLLDQEKTDAIKVFFKLYLYPQSEARNDRDNAFLSLIQLLHEPTKIITLFPSMPRIMWHIGRRFPQALSVGLDSNQAFYLSLVLERDIIDRIVQKYGQENRKNFQVSLQDFKWSYRQNPYSQAHKLYKVGTKIFSTVQDIELIKITREILFLVKEQMEKNTERYGEHILAIDYGQEVLEKTVQIFKGFSKEEIEKLLRIVKILEKKYMNSIFANQDFNYQKLIFKP